MLNNLPDTIFTFSTQSRKTTASLIRQIKADKTQIAALAQNLASFDGSADYSPALALRYSAMNKEAIIDFFRDSHLRTSQYFKALSSVSSVLDSMVYIFSSEILKLEKDIQYLETFIDNYQYISGEDDLFNFNYVENFDNDLASHLADNILLAKPDRDGNNFPEDGGYKVDPVISKISTSNSNSFLSVQGQIKEIKIRTNYSQYTVSETNFDAVLNEALEDAWMVDVKSPVILTSQLDSLSRYIDYDYSYIRGAQAEVVVEFEPDIEIDLLRISPNYSSGLQLLQVVLNKTDPESSLPIGAETEYVDFPVLNAPLRIDKTVDVVFNKCRVNKVTFIFNQSEYTRSAVTASSTEQNAKLVHDLVQKIRSSRDSKYSRMQDLVYYYYRRSRNTQTAKRNARQFTDYYSFRYPIDSTEMSLGVSEKLSSLRQEEADKTYGEVVLNGQSNILSNIVQSTIQHSIESRNNIFNAVVFKESRKASYSSSMASMSSSALAPTVYSNDNNNLAFQKEDAIIPGIDIKSVTEYLQSREQSGLYNYSFSLKNIGFGFSLNQTNSKACFISKKIETLGNPLAIKAIANVTNERRNLNFTNYNLREPGSYELSICIKENPSLESDWIPIAPHNSPSIDSEVVFFSLNKRAKIRFAPRESTIVLYKNGIIENPSKYSYAPGSNELIYNGTIDQSAVYVISYDLNFVDYSQNIIDIDRLNLGQIPVKSYASSTGPGQFFNRALVSNKVVLEYIPYVNSTLLTNAVYSNLSGTINTSANVGYSPVSIIMQDGTPAVNLTNYVANSRETAVFYSTTNYLFIQSGKEILFNRPVNQPFRVYYQYIPSVLRFRLILRNNLPNQYNGISIDNVIIKCKTKNLDPLADKLMRL